MIYVDSCTVSFHYTVNYVNSTSVQIHLDITMQVVNLHVVHQVNIGFFNSLSVCGSQVNTQLK